MVCGVLTAKRNLRPHASALLLLTTACLGVACTPARMNSTLAPADRVDGFAAGYRLVQSPLPGDPLRVSIYELENGLQVYLSENDEQPRIYTEVAVRAGSNQDPADATGLAHYLEHLLFKGTENLGTLDYSKEKPHLDRIRDLYEQHFVETDPAKRREIYAEINREAQLAAAYAIPNELDKLYAMMGGQAVNAHTSVEETVYKVDLPSNRLDQWAIVEAERYASPVFRLFQTELEVVYEEKNRAMDSKERLIWEEVNRRVFAGTPYGEQTTIGEAEHLKNPSLVKIKDYYDKYYVPGNMAILISGRLDKEEAMRTIAQHFNVLPARQVPQPETYTLKPLAGADRFTVTYPGEEYVTLAFRTVHEGHEDEAALKVMDMILSNAQAGLIDINLVQGQRVRSAGCTPMFYNQVGAQYLWGVPKAGQTLEEVEELLLEQVELVKRGEFSDWIIPAVVNDFKKMEKSQAETNAGRVSAMRQSYLSRLPWEHRVQELDRLERVTREDVLRVANKYFGKDFVAGYRRDGDHEFTKIDKPALDKVEIDAARQSAFAASVMAIQPDPIEPQFIVEGEDNQVDRSTPGRTFYYAHNPVNDLFTLRFAVEVGREHNPMLPIAALLLEKSGTREYSADQLRQEFYKLGTDFSISSSDGETSIAISGLDENLRPSLALLMELLRDPQADEATFEELKGIVLAQRADARKDPGTISSAVSQYILYGEKSTFRRLLPSDEVKALGLAETLRSISDLLKYEHVVEYTGSLPMNEAKTMVSAAYPVPAAAQPTPPFPTKRVREPKSDEIYFFDRQMAQSQIRIAFGGNDYNEADVAAVELFNEYFSGGMSGIVFQELREARALAYQAGAWYVLADRLERQNVMVGVIGCQVDKTTESVKAFLELLDSMPESPDRFARAVQALESNYRTSSLNFRDILPNVRSWERLGLKEDPRKTRFEQIRSAKVDTLRAFYEREVQKQPKLISIVGDHSRINMAELEAIGPVRKVSEDDIFVP